jgi:hypothetical protein
MSGAEAPQDLRCPCTRKLAQVTSKGIELWCRGCDKPTLIPFEALANKDRLFAYMSTLPPRRKKGWRRPPK